MAPSPELGQPKAPDKSSSAATTRQNANEIINASPRVAADTQTNCGSNMTSTTNSSGANTSSCSNSCSGGTQPKSGQNIKQMNDDEFLGLLDEAFSYKTPKDRENKSETFRKLLEDVERTKDHQFPAINETRYQRGSSNQHGGSLQDLKETGANDILDNEYTYGRNNRRHHHNWRSQKYSSSVSTRQREGGSLPSNVNASNFYSINEPRFLNEVGNNKRRGKGERTFSGTSSNSGQDSIVSYESKDDSVLGDHTTITEIDIFEDAPLAPQGKHKPVDIDVGVEVYATMNLKTTVEISCSEKSDGHWVDNTVSFPSLERSKANDATTCALPFDDSSEASQSVLGKKLEKPKTAIYQSSKVIPQQLDENSNAIVTKKKKKFDADRNTTTVDLTEVEGYRGHDPIETLVKFIENTDATETARKSDKLTSMASGGKKKEKKKDKEVKKDVHKVKKSSSLEELRSCTKLDEDDKLSAGVIMRTKGKKSSTTVYTSPTDGKENIIKQNTKRGERRSWGTEELTYLGENNAIEEVREKNKEKEKSKKAKEMMERQVENTKLEKLERIEKIPQKKKKNERSLSVLSMESAQSETAEFHVVTKKKRSKKRQSLEETRSTTGKVGASFSLKSGSGINKKYQTSSSFANDRDAYLTSYNPHDSRRKTTSSVPPSEKSDSSDLDSVHSLPIESVTGRHQSGGNSQMQNQSYADIARTVNANKASLMAWQAQDGNEQDKWPVVSASNTSQIASLIAMESGLSAIPSNPSKNRTSSTKPKSLVKDFPDLAADRRSRASNSYDGASSCSSSSSTSTIVKHVGGYVQSLSDEKIIATEPVVKGPVKLPAAAAPSKLTDVVRGAESVKQTLQKSKSADNERFYNVEQYPALEKTVKRHSTQNSISDIKALQNQGSGTGISFSAGNQVISSKQRSPPTSSVHIQQQQQQQQSSTPISHTVAMDSVSGVADVCLSSSTNAFAASNSATTASISSATSALSDTSKIVINNNLDMNTNIAATSSSSSNNLGNMISSTSSSIIVANNGKKIKANTKASSESSAPSLLEANNAKNSTQQPSQAPMTMAMVSNDGSSQSGALDHINYTVTPSINAKPVAKVDTQLSQHAVNIVFGNPTMNRKSKKEGHHLNSSTNVSGDEQPLNVNQQTSLASTQSKHSNRPAVIILNDSSDCGMYSGSDFTFGDFNEEELRLFESNHHLDDSGSYNVSVPDVNSSSSIVSDTVHEDIHLSPHSDQGYSSSNNRSIFSESIDQNNIASNIGGSVSRKGSGVVYMSFETDPSAVSAHISDDCRILPMNASPFPNDSAIIMATTSSSIPSQYNPNSHLPPTQSNIVVTNLGTTHVFPVASLASTSSTTTTTSSALNSMKVLGNHIANNSSNSKMKESKINEHNKYETGGITNDLKQKSSTNSDNVNISNIVNNNTTINKSNSNNKTSKINVENSTTKTILPLFTTPPPPISSSSAATTLPLLANNKLTGHEAKAFVDNCTNNNNYTNRTAAGTAAANQQKSNCDTLKRMVNNNHNNNNNRKEINIRFVAPTITHDINSANYEKLVDFVGLAWEDILHGVNGETEYYDGQ